MLITQHLNLSFIYSQITVARLGSENWRRMWRFCGWNQTWDYWRCKNTLNCGQVVTSFISPPPHLVFCCRRVLVSSLLRRRTYPRVNYDATVTSIAIATKWKGRKDLSRKSRLIDLSSLPFHPDRLLHLSGRLENECLEMGFTASVLFPLRCTYGQWLLIHIMSLAKQHSPIALLDVPVLSEGAAQLILIPVWGVTHSPWATEDMRTELIDRICKQSLNQPKPTLFLLLLYLFDTTLKCNYQNEEWKWKRIPAIKLHKPMVLFFLYF